MGAAKAISQVKGHRTKAEKEIREKGEKSILTGSPLAEFEEVKKSEYAHREFKRVKKLLKAIEKDDAIFSAIVNRYCKIREEIAVFEGLCAQTACNMTELEDRLREHGIEFEVYLERSDSLGKTLAAYDRQITAKRKMCFDIEREMCMTVASGIRNIPKKPDDEKKNPLFRALMSDDED